MSIDWSPLRGVIEQNERFLVTTHVRPDGDALGSEVGIVGLLRQFGKDVRVVNASQTPARYDFLDSTGTMFEHYASVAAADDLTTNRALVIVDLSSWSQLGDMAEFVRSFPGPRVVIDHHLGHDDLGAIMLKDQTAEAAGLLVMDGVLACGGVLDTWTATGLLTAIAMDTGWFRHPSTRPRTLRAAAQLMEAGAAINDIYRNLYERNTLGRMRLIGETLSRLTTTLGGRIAYATVTKADLARAGAIPSDSEDLVDYTASIRGVELGMLFIEQPRGGVRVSLRARTGLDCSSLARSFGGGGHHAAAAASLPGSMDESVEVVLGAAKSALEQHRAP